jgi:CubicO group peptidase (beta-lactamase class C family)
MKLFTKLKGFFLCSTTLLLANGWAQDELPTVSVEDFARMRAHIVCTGVLVQKLSMAQALETTNSFWHPTLYAPPEALPQDHTLDISVEANRSIVTANDATGEALAHAVYLPDGGGCVTTRDPSSVAATSEAVVMSESEDGQITWTLADTLSGDDQAALEEKVNALFTSEGLLAGISRGIVILHADQLVAEQYASGYGPENLFWSASNIKVILNAFAGLLARDGKLDVNAPTGFAAWSGADDPRAAITVDNLLRMVSGLEYSEEAFNEGEDLYNIMYQGPESYDVAGFMAQKPLEVEPGTQYEYSSGGSILLARILQDKLSEGSGREELLAYLRENLFTPIGMNSTVVEFDEAGTMLAGYGGFMSVRDQARLGTLYLHDGMFAGKRILPEGWVAYSTIVTPGSEEGGGYGASVSLNKFEEGTLGHLGSGEQYIIVSPERNVVISFMASSWDFETYEAVIADLEARMVEILNLFPKE